MTIAHEASTGLDANSSALGATSSTIPYVGVAAGRMALLFVAVQPSTATFGADPAGWAKLGERAGGADPHPSAGTPNNNTSKIGVWAKTLTGAETGNVVVTNTGGDSNAGCMSSYSTTAGGWEALTFVTGDDNAHGNDRTATAGSWTLAAGDMVVAAFASDRALNTIPPSAGVFSQSGATFGAVTTQNRRLSNTSNDSSANTFDALVSAGSTGALTASFSQASQQCGPLLAIRLRESAPAGTNAPAGAATGTGAAQNAQPSIGAAANPATAVAAALQPSTAVAVLAGCAESVGVAGQVDADVPTGALGPRVVDAESGGRITASSRPRIMTTTQRGRQ